MEPIHFENTNDFGVGEEQLIEIYNRLKTGRSLFTTGELIQHHILKTYRNNLGYFVQLYVHNQKYYVLDLDMCTCPCCDRYANDFLDNLDPKQFDIFQEAEKYVMALISNNSQNELKHIEDLKIIASQPRLFGNKGMALLKLLQYGAQDTYLFGDMNNTYVPTIITNKRKNDTHNEENYADNCESDDTYTEYQQKKIKLE